MKEFNRFYGMTNDDCRMKEPNRFKESTKEEANGLIASCEFWGVGSGFFDGGLQISDFGLFEEHRRLRDFGELSRAVAGLKERCACGADLRSFKSAGRCLEKG